ncbi:MAG TPA: hypothetical protein VGN97_12280 [Mesorhizobium sp.]|jgi:hypothetical protein|nr:hypothetical protein [Mesorhizobium sp.]
MRLRSEAAKRRLDQTLSALALISLAALALAWAVREADAQVLCTSTDAMLRRLQERYGEEPTAAGVSARGELITLVVDPKDGSWSVVRTLPNGMTCGVIGGEGWEAAPAKDVGEPT